MAGDSSSGRYDTADGKMSMESVFVEHFMRALDDLTKQAGSPPAKAGG